MTKHTILNHDNDQVAWLILDHATEKMNILSSDHLKEIQEKVASLCENPGQTKGLVIVSGKEHVFTAGANIEEIAEFDSEAKAEEGAGKMQEIFNQIAEAPFPTVAAIHGPCLGGGVELSLACDWRVATDDDRTKMGLPEIQIGLIPGAGGCQRLPRLIGVQKALDMILTGRRLNGSRALKSGLIDACVPLHLLKAKAKEYTKKKRGKTGGTKSNISKDLPKWALEGNSIGRRVMYKKARDMVDEKTKGFYPASYKALEAVFDGFELPLKAGLKLERKLFGQLSQTNECKSLIHLFHATTHIKKNPYENELKEKFGDSKTEAVGVIGAGFMGAGIATVCADKGIRARMSDPSSESIGKALKSAKTFFQKKVDRRRIKPHNLIEKMGHISPGLDTSGFKTVEVAIEAVFEDVELKQKILAGLEENASEDFIFASNTSALPIKDIAAKAKMPERVVGMHFFSPVEKMPLLEVVETDQTAPWVTGRVVQLGQAIGKQVIVVKDGPGFYTTRALAFLLSEAAMILNEGNTIEHIDKALTDFGFPVGPITLIDEVGIDVGFHVLETMVKAYPTRAEMPKNLESILNSGRMGRKNEKGFYRYENGKKKSVDDEIYKLLNISPEQKLPMQNIVERCVLLFVNESVRCLEDNVLSHPHDGDVGAVFGLGFPPFWGGPFKYVDLVGCSKVVETLFNLEKSYGERFQPAKMLQKMAAESTKFFPEE